MKGIYQIIAIIRWIVIPSVLLFSCRMKEQRPANILPQEKMVKILSEVYITEEKVSKLALGPDSSKFVFELLQGKIFETSGVTDSVFKRSLNYYMDHPKEMEKLYGALVDSLQLREQRVPFKTH